MTVADTSDRLHVPPPRAPYDGRDVAVVAGAAAAATVVAVVAHFAVPRLQPLVGLIVILTIAYALSTNRRAIDRRTVAWGLALQFLFALIVLKTTIGQRVFQTLGDVDYQAARTSHSSDRASCSGRSGTKRSGRAS